MWFTVCPRRDTDHRVAEPVDWCFVCGYRAPAPTEKQPPPRPKREPTGNEQENREDP
mgnify:CR=1 FL=1